MRPVLRPFLATSARLTPLARLPARAPALCLARRAYATDAEEDLINEDKEQRKKRLKSYTIRERLRRRVWGDDPLEPAQYEKMYNRDKELALRPVVEDPNYVEATDGRGLPIIGLVEPAGKWQVDTFGASTKVRDTEGVHIAIHRALVETLTLQLNGRAPADMFTYDTPRDVETATHNVAIEVDTTGEIKLTYGPGAEGEILQSLQSAAESSESESDSDSDAEAEAVVEDSFVDAAAELAGEPIPEAEKPAFLTKALEGEGWIHAPLADPQITFALNKRILHLTGRKVPDAVASQAKTVNDILQAMVIQPKPKKLAEELLENEKLVSLPNVKIVETKLRPLDKEKLIGRAILFPHMTDHKYEGVDPEEKAKPFKGGISTAWFKKTYKL